MRYKIIAKQYKQPGHLIVQLANGQMVRGLPEAMGRHLSVGDAGTLVAGHKRQHFRPDAIEGDYVEV